MTLCWILASRAPGLLYYLAVSGFPGQLLAASGPGLACAGILGPGGGCARAPVGQPFFPPHEVLSLGAWRPYDRSLGRYRPPWNLQDCLVCLGGSCIEAIQEPHRSNIGDGGSRQVFGILQVALSEGVAGAQTVA
ncbi:hypothetical protein NDU88_004608 [Pleurodeles waltl]|uniref:Uncharacterized protein n=1 Tax=Pleurodeles waltl TaxID=8319 RepID=A0AAV7MWW5_PLEWA|nr:hypothetical protein NDU88_004608 [Pleurodeles waltl]